ncbi:uncharacterized protein MONBRDRAFT_1704, partial [Monosiga brevicollis MX1]
LSYAEFGDPVTQLRFEEAAEAPLGRDQVRVRMLAAAINPADINQVQGRYASQPPLPAVGGNEGVGEIVEAGPNVDPAVARVGQRVVFGTSQMGTWSEFVLAGQDQVLVLDDDTSVEHASCMMVSACTAYRMLHDFVQLQPGDIVLQNGATSAVGRAVIQIAKSMGVTSVNVLRRERPDLEGTVSELRSLGADVLAFEEDLETREGLRQLRAQLDRPVHLALNCVGGKSATNLTRLVGQRASLVTYGGMSLRPTQLSTAKMIFEDLRLFGYWMTRW